MKKLLVLFGVLSISSLMLFSQSIQVLSPNGGEQWKCGKKVTIKWSSSQVGRMVKIGLRKGNKTLTPLISSGAPNSGSFSFTVPNNLEPGSDYKLGVSNATQTVYDLSDNFFTVLPCPDVPVHLKMITIEKPAIGDIWQIGEQRELVWRTNFTEPVFEVHLYNFDENEQIVRIHDGFLEPDRDNKFRVTWHIPPIHDFKPGYYKIRILARGIKQFSKKFFIRVPLETYTVTLKPLLIKNSYPQYAPKPSPGTARAGVMFPEHGSFAVGAQILFGVESFKGNKDFLLQAILHLRQVYFWASSIYPYTCPCEVLILTEPYIGTGGSYNGWVFKTIPNDKPGDLISIDVTQQVSPWLTGQDPNYGFFISGRKLISGCFSLYKPELELKFLGIKD